MQKSFSEMYKHLVHSRQVTLTHTKLLCSVFTAMFQGRGTIKSAIVLSFREGKGWRIQEMPLTSWSPSPQIIGSFNIHTHTAPIDPTGTDKMHAHSSQPPDGNIDPTDPAMLPAGQVTVRAFFRVSKKHRGERGLSTWPSSLIMGFENYTML